jgi:hypothetical protein
MVGENQESRGALGLIPALRARIAGYREQAAHFARLADAEPVEKIRDQWTTVARDYAYLARTLEPDGGLRTRDPAGRISLRDTAKFIIDHHQQV